MEKKKRKKTDLPEPGVGNVQRRRALELRLSRRELEGGKLTEEEHAQSRFLELVQRIGEEFPLENTPDDGATSGTSLRMELAQQAAYVGTPADLTRMLVAVLTLKRRLKDSEAYGTRLRADYKHVNQHRDDLLRTVAEQDARLRDMEFALRAARLTADAGKKG